MHKLKGIMPAGLVIGFAVFAIALFVTVLIIANVRVALTPSLASLDDAGVNSTVTNIVTQFNNAVSLLVIALIVGAASVIIAVAMSIGGGGRGRR